jgi:oxygen-independent coproporphyrinogen-3 oxidase
MNTTTDTKTARRLPQIETSLASGSPYVAYTYSYPHKTAYRRLDPPRALEQVWAGEKRDALFLYLHVPFCEMRCGFCNLFTTANPREELTRQYLAAFERQGRVVREALGGEDVNVARLAIGGGTPTYLAPAELERLLTICRDLFGVQPGSIPMSVETSPRTAEPDRLRVLKEFGVDRISIGVQSFIDAEVAASARAQTAEWVDAALSRIRALDFPTLNLDLIYGLPGQTVASWLASLDAALRWRPEELYLYPLYVRPMTGLDRRGCPTHDGLRLDCYRAGRDKLLAGGYEQVSMRMFRRRDARSVTPDVIYCCQDDGMVGLGCGARSYTHGLHYSTDYAVGSTGVREIIDDYLHRSDEAFRHADYGCEVDARERKRRWVIKSLFRNVGLDRRAYRQQFGEDVLTGFAELLPLIDAGYFRATSDRLLPTDAGLERSDSLGPMLFSNRVKATMAEFDIR